MKKGIWVLLILVLCLGFAACSKQESEPPADEQPYITEENPQQEQTDAETSTEIAEIQSEDVQEADLSENNTEISEKTEDEREEERKAVLTIGEQEFSVTLYDTPAAIALYDMLPLELTFEDYNGIEKIAFMDGDLPIDGEPDEFDPDEGDLCLYAPWGNLTIFYKDFRVSNGLISLGHIDSGVEIIGSIDEDFSATLSKE